MAWNFIFRNTKPLLNNRATSSVSSSPQPVNSSFQPLTARISLVQTPSNPPRSFDENFSGLKNLFAKGKRTEFRRLNSISDEIKGNAGLQFWWLIRFWDVLRVRKTREPISASPFFAFRLKSATKSGWKKRSPSEKIR